MKLRDEFAINVLPSVLKIMNAYGKNKKIIVEEIDVAKTCYSYADAMMKARGVQSKKE